MSGPAPLAIHVLRFDSFELDLHAGELRRGGVRLRLQGQPIQLLGILVQNAGTLLTREELSRQLWPADTFVDFEHGLHNSIARIREVLGDSVETPRFIETLPRRGYRFIASVQRTDEVQVSSPTAARDGTLIAETPGSATVPGRGRVWVLALGACAAIGVAASLAWPRSSAERVFSPLRSIAVLPLKNLSGDSEQEYFADGMTEELITEMSRIQTLKVISHTSVMEYKATTKHLPQIARELGVENVVEGSVVRDGDQIRVTVQLLDGASDRHLWSEDYRRPLRGILDLQQEIAEKIAQQIRVKLTSDGRGRLPAREVDPAAYEAYLRGRYYLNSQFSTVAPLRAAKGYFEESIRKDAGLALAYAGLADSELSMASFRHISPESGYRSAKQAVRKALELNGGLGEAHTTLALLSWQYEWDWKTAEHEFEYAIALAPSYDCAHVNYANYLAWRGRRAEALAEITKSRELSPGSSFASAESAVYFQLRDYPRLVEASRKGVISDPNEWLEHFFLGMGYEGLGKRAEAIAEYETAVQMSDGDQDPTAALAHAYAVIGRRAEAEKILRPLEQEKDSYVSPYMIATVYAGLGDKDRAFAFLTRAYQEKSPDMVWNLKVDPRLDSLRSEPQFETLLRQAGFPSAGQASSDIRVRAHPAAAMTAALGRGALISHP